MSKCSKYVQNHVHIKTVCVFPHDFSPDGLVQTLPRVYTEVLGPLDDIIERNRKQLSGINNAAAEMYSSQESKRQWWKDRQDVDFELSCLVEKPRLTTSDQALSRWFSIKVKALRTITTIHPCLIMASAVTFQKDLRQLSP